MIQELQNGVFLLGKFGPVKCGAWLLRSGNDAALFEMPEYEENDIPPCAVAEDAINSLGLNLRYVFLSHPHRDHYDSIDEYRQAFPQAVFVGHKTFAYILENECNAEILKNEEIWRSLPDRNDNFDFLFEDRVFLDLGYETISIIHAPKHSPGDTLLIFKDILFTGDWWMLEGDPGNCEEVAQVANQSIKRLVALVAERGLRINHMFPSHANNFLFNIDFHDVMYRTLMPAERPKAQLCPVKPADLVLQKAKRTMG